MVPFQSPHTHLNGNVKTQAHFDREFEAIMSRSGVRVPQLALA